MDDFDLHLETLRDLATLPVYAQEEDALSVAELLWEGVELKQITARTPFVIANYIIAYSLHIVKAERVTPGQIEQLISIVDVIPAATVQSCPGLRQIDDAPVADGLTKALVEAVLSLTVIDDQTRAVVFTKLAAFEKRLLDGLAGKDHHHVVDHIIPALHGFGKAIDEATSYTCTASEALSLPTASEASYVALNNLLVAKLDGTSRDGRRTGANLQRYMVRPNSAALISLRARNAALSASLSPDEVADVAVERDIWQLLGAYPANKVGGIGSHGATTLSHASRELDNALRLGQTDDDGAELDGSILVEQIKAATLASVASRNVDQNLLDTLFTLTSESTSVIDLQVQLAAVQSLRIFVVNFRELAGSVAQHLRKYITSPFSLLEAEDGSRSPDLLILSSRSLAFALKVANNRDNCLSTVYSLLNYLPAVKEGTSVRSSLYAPGGTTRSDSQSFRTGAGGNPRSDEQKSQISINALYAVTQIALELEDGEITRLSVSILLQRLRGTHAAVEQAVLENLASIAVLTTDAEFASIVRAFSDVSRSTALFDDEPLSTKSAVLTAQTRLAQSLSVSKNKLERAHLYLGELLELFIARGLQLGQQPQHRAQLIAHMLALLPVLETILSTPDFLPQHEPDEETVNRFRNFWFLIILDGFLANQSTAAWQRTALMQIATKTPCLVRGAAADYIQNDLEYNSVLRKDFAANTPSTDVQRSELSSAIPQQIAAVRALTHAQSALLLVILRVESLRAQAGRPSMVLAYFAYEGLSTGPLHTCLQAIADKVNAAYRMYLSDSLADHTLEPSAPGELNAIALHCCQPLPFARKAAISFMSTIVQNFRSILCQAACVTTLLEMLTLLRRACEAQYDDEYSPVYHFHSDLAGFTIKLPDEYAIRDAVLKDVNVSVRAWLSTTLSRSPFEMQGLLQNYIRRTDVYSSFGQSEMGKSVALDLARSTPGSAKESNLPAWGGWQADSSVLFANSFATRQHFRKVSYVDSNNARNRLAELSRRSKAGHHVHIPSFDLREYLHTSASAVIAAKEVDQQAVHHIVTVPVRILSADAVASGVEVWSWMISQRPALEPKIVAEVASAWIWTIHHRKGLFSSQLNTKNPLLSETEYTPTDKKGMTKNFKAATKLLSPHAIMLEFFWSRFQVFRYSDKSLVGIIRRVVQLSCGLAEEWCTHALSRELRCKFLVFAFCVLQGSRTEAIVENELREKVYHAALSWFNRAPAWTFGSNRLQLDADLRALKELQDVVTIDKPSNNFWATSSANESSLIVYPGGLSVNECLQRHTDRRQLLQLLLESEISRLGIWMNPLHDPARGADKPTPILKGIADGQWPRIARIAWQDHPALAIHMTQRFKIAAFVNEVTRLVRTDPERARDTQESLGLIIDGGLKPETRSVLKYLVFWSAVTPVEALKFFLPAYEANGMLIQYAMRVLEQHPVELVFFYIPQVVQALRTDDLGYVERFIFETSKISQLFCHQIIWNMKANCYMDDDAEEEDPMKPTFDRMIDMVVEALSGDAKKFYEREFTFFDEVTSISKKLQPFIKKGKQEKKAKIDEEMGKIKVDEGVYLPSNPDGVVVDIDRHSGRPLQSHAKAPFMATFKIRKEHKDQEPGEQTGPEKGDDKPAEGGDGKSFEIWQAAIFKVGDDCRQDILALQMIAQFKNMFMENGLHLQLVPYRVTATGPGMGVIDVVPNATSRDEMGRQKINDLHAFFLHRFGDEKSETYQRARVQFIQSMAAYSVVCHICQIRDRHNGNIMIDGEGNIIHIDFGFLFDIGPGGMKFEPYSFKLTHEMVDVMGGADSQGYRLFSELTIKAYLACRPYVDEVCETARLMMGTGLPSFKGEPTIQRLRDRFKPELSERAAAEWMKGLIDNAQFSNRSILYDVFQTAQNGIPFKR